MTKILTLAALLALSTGLSAQAQTTWVATGPNGGTASGTRDCTAVDGARHCTGERTATGAYGYTRSTDTERVTQYGSSTVTGTRTGPGGRTGTFTRSWSR